jgi:anti-sigma factor ChrR (cupin superfamily)
MLINADFDRRAVVHAAKLDWIPSPIANVERRMLDRIGDEVARATSIVRYAAGSSFSPHTHDGGEEFLVLDGVFQDEHGEYPAGTYVRNPPTSRHIPRTELGCLIFVKLHQFDPSDRTFVRIDTANIERTSDPNRSGVEVSPLFEDARETVQLETISPGASFEIGDPGGFEMLVIDGTLTVDGEECAPQSWLRLPPDDRAKLAVPSSPATVWVKRRHLRRSVLSTSLLTVS